MGLWERVAGAAGRQRRAQGGGDSKGKAMAKGRVRPWVREATTADADSARAVGAAEKAKGSRPAAPDEVTAEKRHELEAERGAGGEVVKWTCIHCKRSCKAGQQLAILKTECSRRDVKAVGRTFVSDAKTQKVQKTLNEQWAKEKLGGHSLKRGALM